MNFLNRTVGATLLVSGTCIGAGMLGLPVKTAGASLYVIFAAFLLVWALMTLTALYMLEAALWSPKETNLISMAHLTYGKKGSVIVGVTYLIFLYAIMAAYTSGGSSLVKEMSYSLFKVMLSDQIAMISFVIPFMVIVYLGSKVVDYTNRLLMLGLIMTYLVLTSYVVKKHDLNFSHHVTQTSIIYAALPLIVTSFGFHLLIPSLKSYLSDHISSLKSAIVIGSILSLLVYIIWEFSILTALPLTGTDGLLTMLQEPGNPADLLTKAISRKNAMLGHIISGFSLCALLSSFIGVALGLCDFLADGLRIKKSYVNSILLIALTFLPPIIFSMVYPKGFLLALSYASIFAALLLIIYPALIVWSGRYQLKIQSHYRVWGGKLTLSIAIIFGIVIIFLEMMNRLGKLTSI